MGYNVCSSSIQASKMFVKLGVNLLMASFSYFLGSVLPWAPHTSQLNGNKEGNRTSKRFWIQKLMEAC